MSRLAHLLLCSALMTPALAGCQVEDEPTLPDQATTGHGFVGVMGESVPISYEVRDGAAYVGGDIRFELDQIHETPAGARSALSGGLWPSRRIAYTIAMPASDSRYPWVQAAIAEYNTRTTIQLVPRTNETAWIDFQPTTARYSSSNLGYGGTGANPVWIAATQDTGAVIHELGHRIGLAHEHQRPDRDLYIDMYTPGNPRGLPNYHCTNGYRDSAGSPIHPGSDPRSVYDSSHCAGYSENFDILSVTPAGPIDFDSIMMYVPWAGGLQDASGELLTNPLTPGLGYCTMLKRGTSLAGLTFDQLWHYNQVLSAQDVANISSLYPSEPTRVGWIDLGGACPEGTRNFLVDDENTGNGTQARMKTGWTWIPDHTTAWPTAYTRPRGIYPFGIGTRMDFCRQTIPRLPRLRGDYVVLRLSAQCPLGSYAFRRTSDNEDDNDQNGNSMNVAPSAQTRTPTHGWTDMEFCFVPGDAQPGNTTPPPWRGQGRAAFTNAWVEYPGCNEYHWHLQDDENNSNANGYYFPPETLPFRDRITAIVGGGPNTEYVWNACP